jgi:probable rRNA maturation factor
MTPLQIEISRNAEGWPEALDARADEAVRAAMRLAKPRVSGPAELSIVLTDDAEQRELNRDWRGIDKSTNVLSFPQIEPFAPVFGLLGDIILARETVEREAVEQGVPFSDHFTHLVVHGFLHVLGYDHIEDADALVMEGLETQILASLGVADPYADES